ncbi:ABC transporter permease [Acidaminobacter sp. JC074]|uniref:ABC transporter permease n=1 Tax=Acidaminobacter sp. JC074 TaxID=2530199 RepID=UPI001F0D3C46|nr:ABC transporter permease [Acidaminobacter sp. JC074]MCH4889894.1 ABC transporter permease [Acidaminobacter sp. JC074]
MGLINLIKKDLKIVVTDRKALIMLVAMPIILYTILSLALAGSFGSGDDEVWKINIGIVKSYTLEDRGDYLSLEDAKELDGILTDVLDSEDLSFVAYEFLDYDQAIKRIEEDSISSVVVLPETYLKDIALNMSPAFRKKVSVEVIRNQSRQYSSDIVEKLIGGVMDQLSQVMIMNKVSYETLNHFNVDSQIIDQVMTGLQEREQSPLEVKSSLYRIDKLKLVNSGQYYSTAMMAMFLLFGASYGAKFMLLEKRNYTLQRQLSAGISSKMVVFGKLTLIFIIVIMQISLMILTSHFGFGVYWGRPSMLMLAILIVAFSVTGFGTLLAALALKAGDLKLLNVLESGIFQILALFGGSYFPLFMMPAWFQWISRILLNGASLEIFQKVMMEASLREMMPSMVSLIINGLVFMVLGLMIISNKKTHRSVQLEEVTA